MMATIRTKSPVISTDMPIHLIHRWSLLLLAIVPLGSGAGTPSTEAIVTFNTVCARCHEGECSGRLSFTDARNASRGHILRHFPAAGNQPGMVGELFELLDHMKEACAFYSLQPPAGPARKWDGKALERYTTANRRNLFIPIGRLVPGDYRLHLRMESDVRVKVHLIAENFDLVVETCENTSNGKLALPFTIEEPGSYFLRLYPQKPVRVEELTIK